MGLMNFPETQQIRKDASPAPKFRLPQFAEPVLIAQKKFWQTDPKGYLQLLIMGVSSILLIIGSIIRPLSPWLYIAFCFYIISYFQLPQELYKTIKRKKK